MQKQNEYKAAQKIKYDLILASENDQGRAADLIVDLGLLETAEFHKARGCDCDFCIGFQIGVKSESLKARLIRAERSTRKKGGGRKPSLDAAGVRLAEKMLFEGKEISDIAKQLVCSERTIRRVLNGEHKYSGRAV